MTFNRKFVQETCEHELGYSTHEDIRGDRKRLPTISFTPASLSQMKRAALDDLPNYYFKALVSLFEAIDAVSEKKYSWATVKLYYSVYYLLQVELLERGVVLVRAGGIYRMKLLPGETFFNKKDGKYNNDHSGTILHFMDLFKSSDPLLSNDIDGKKSYLWLLGKRERINYREREFNEPNYPDFWQGPVSFGLDKASIESTVQNYLDDSYMAYSFQEDHAVLSIPLQRLLQTRRTLDLYSHSGILSQNKKDYLMKILPCESLKEYVEL